jgi:hypothetical protein
MYGNAPAVWRSPSANLAATNTNTNEEIKLNRASPASPRVSPLHRILSGLAASLLLNCGTAGASHPGAAWEWLPGEQPSAFAPKSMLRGLARSLSDRPDTVQGPQVHVMYVLPSDGADEQLDTNGQIGTSVMAFNRWMANNTWGKAFRIDTFDGLPDVSFFRLSRTDAQMRAVGAYVRDEIEKDLKAAGLIRPDKLYAVYYGGSSSWSCGGGAWPPALPGQVGAMYLKGQAPGAPACSTNPVGASLEAPGYMDFGMLHELVHTLGYVATCAPHHVLNGHASDNRNDLMYAGSESWQLPPRLDIGRDDYYGHGRAGCADLATSAYLSNAEGAPVTNLWWNPAESGWGLNLNQQGDTVFATLFNYAGDGRDMWLVASGLTRQADNRFTGSLYRTTGPAFNASPWTSVGVAEVGTMALSFESVNRATVTYTVNGAAVTRAIEPQLFATPRPSCSLTSGSRAAATNYQDLWWNPAESGWGLNLTHQGNLIFATLFTYANDNRDLWLVASSLARQADGSFSGALYRTTGRAFNSATWATPAVSEVGTMRLAFSNGTSGTVTYSVNGTTVTKAIERQVFDARPSICQ